MKKFILILLFATSPYASTYLSVSNHYINVGKVFDKIDIGIGLGYSLDFSSYENQLVLSDTTINSNSKNYLFSLSPDISIRYYFYRNSNLDFFINSISSVEFPVLKDKNNPRMYCLSEIVNLGSEYYLYKKVSIGLGIGPRFYETIDRITTGSSRAAIRQIYIVSSYDVQLRYYF